jgi:hypothetical protein
MKKIIGVLVLGLAIGSVGVFAETAAEKKARQAAEAQAKQDAQEKQKWCDTTGVKAKEGNRNAQALWFDEKCYD